MYVLFIPSFPNNRFHLGNIRNNTLCKQERKERKKEEEQKEAEVQSLRYKQLRILYSLTFFAKIFVTVFFFVCFYILYDDERVTLILLRLFFRKLLFLVFFFLFFFFSLRVSQIWQQLELLFLFWGFVIVCKETRGGSRHHAGSFVCFSRHRGFRLEFRLNFSIFRAKVSRLLLAHTRKEGEMCFTQNIRSRITRKKNKK